MSKPHHIRNQEDSLKRFCLIALGIAVLIAVFLFQKLDYAHLILDTVDLEYGDYNQRIIYLFNKVLRFFINDAMSIMIIYALFYERKYLLFSIYVQLFGMVFILIPYLVLKQYFFDYNGPMLSHLHRLVLNPVLLMLLIPLLLYHKRLEQGSSAERNKQAEPDQK